MEERGVILLGILQPYAILCSDGHYVLPHCAGQPGCGLAVPEGSHNCPHRHLQRLQARLYPPIAPVKQRPGVEALRLLSPCIQQMSGMSTA